MAEVVLRVCDRCDAPHAVTYRVSAEGKSWTVDLCSSCSEPLRASPAPAPKGTRRKANRFQILEVEGDDG